MMKQNMYKIAGIGAICLAFALKGISQNETPPVPAPEPPVPQTEVSADSNDNQSEIIIHQKGGGNSKVTIEIRNGDVFVNGKPLDKFEDQNIEIERRKMGPEDAAALAYTSPFRENLWDQERFSRDLQRKIRSQQGMQMRIQNRMVNSNAAFLGVSSRKSETGGATVLEVTKSSPAEKAGIKKGDVIIGVNDEKIENPENLFETVHKYKPGEKVKITFKRVGKEQTVSAILDKSKNEPFTYDYGYKYEMPEMPEMPEISGMPGMESPLWGPMPPKIGIKAQDSEEGKGVNVLEVTDGSPAEKAGLKKGDVITNFDGSEVNNANDLIQKVRESREKSRVKVKILRDGKSEEMDIKIPRKLKTAEL